MKNLNVTKISIILVIAITLASSCNSSKKNILGNYDLELFDEGGPLYYVNKRGVTSGGGVFDGIIKKIGIDGVEIYAEVKRLSSSDPDGWYKLNINSGVVSGPLDINLKCIEFKIVDVADFYNNIDN